VTQDSWPSVEPPAPSALPRVEELPVVAQGYDRERVREAFDSFYRHLARLDTTLRALEAVDVFQAQAKELRKELRALRMDGWVQQSWQPYASAAPRVRTGLPEAVPRMAIEAVFIIAVAVGAYEASLKPLVLAAVMLVAVLIVGVVEWAVARERAVPAPARPVAESEPEAAAVEEPAAAPAAAEPWEAPAAVAEASPEPEPEEQTAIAAPAAEPEPVPEPEAVEEPEPEPEPEPAPGPEAAEEPEPPDEPEPAEEPEPEPELAPAAESNGAEDGRRRWWRRGRREEHAEELALQPRHVRVLPADGAAREPARHVLDPWEEDFDLSLDETPSDDALSDRK